MVTPTKVTPTTTATPAKAAPTKVTPTAPTAVPAAGHNGKATTNNSNTTNNSKTSASNNNTTNGKKSGEGGENNQALSEDKAFRKEVGEFIVHYLKKYLDNNMIASKEDFKHLARKLTHLVVEKEQRGSLLKKHKRGLTFNEKVKKKVSKFVDEFFDKLPGPYSKKSK